MGNLVNVGNCHNLRETGYACFTLSRVAKVVSSEVARSCYFIMVHSLLQYGAELWAGATDWERTSLIQKRAIRFVEHVAWNTPGRPYFKQLIYQVAVYSHVRNNLKQYSEPGCKHQYSNRDRHNLLNLPLGLVKSAKLTHVKVNHLLQVA